MPTAVEWEKRYRDRLEQMKMALNEKDQYAAENILEQIAPHPKGDNVFVKQNFSGYGLFCTTSVRVLDPDSGVMDNPDGVACIKKDGTRMWYYAGMLHNKTGPAVIKPNGKLEYYYLGTKKKNAEDLDATVRSANEHAERNKRRNEP